MKIGVEQLFNYGRDIIEATFKVVYQAGITDILRNKDIPEEDKPILIEEVKQLSIRRVEEKVLEHVFEHINEQAGERRNPTYLNFCVYETHLIEEGKPILMMHPADMVDYLRKGVILHSSTPSAKEAE